MSKAYPKYKKIEKEISENNNENLNICKGQIFNKNV